MKFLRSLLFHIYYYLITAYILIVYGGISYFKPDFSIEGFRSWCRLMIWGMNKIAKIYIEIRGTQNLPKGGALIASKHQSALETILIFAIFEKPCAVLKKELGYVPFASAMIKGAGHIPVDRKAGAKARHAIINMAHDRIEKGHQIVIYPEGTRSLVNSTPSYKRGVFGIYQSLNIPCIPVALNTGLFWGKNSFLINSGTVIIELLEPIGEGLPVDAFMSELTTRIESTTARLVHEAVFREKEEKKRSI